MNEKIIMLGTGSAMVTDCYNRGIGSNFRTNGRVALDCICKQGKARNAVRKRHADYGCTESLFWIYQYRRR